MLDVAASKIGTQLPVFSAIALIVYRFGRASATSPFVPVACQSGSMDPDRSKSTKIVKFFVYRRPTSRRKFGIKLNQQVILSRCFY